VLQLMLAHLLAITTKELAGLLNPILVAHHLLSTSVEVQSRSLGTTTTVLSQRLSLVMLKHFWPTPKELLRKVGSLLSVPSGSTPLLSHPSHRCTMLLLVSGKLTLLTQQLVSVLVSVLPLTSLMVPLNAVNGLKMPLTVSKITKVLWDTSI